MNRSAFSASTQPPSEDALPMDRSLRQILHQLDSLPSLPAVANAVLEHVLTADSENAVLARIIETDPSLTLKLLEHANSALYARNGSVTQVIKALNRLGRKVVQALLLSVLIKDSLVKGDKTAEAEQTMLWRHSLATGVLASLIAAKSCPALAVEAFGAGVMHDIGRIFLRLYASEEYALVDERVREMRESVMEAEQEVFKTDHAVVGRWIAQKWKLPPALTEVIWLHHHSAQALSSLQIDVTLVAVVALANLLAHATLIDEPRMVAQEQQRLSGLMAMLKLGQGDLNAIQKDFASAFAERAASFDLEADQVALFLSSLQKANQSLMHMSLELDQANSRLEDANRFANLGSRVGLKMSKAGSVEDVFDSIASCMQEAVGVRGGFVYWIVPAERLAQGIIWNGAGSQRSVSYPLDGDGMPDLDRGMSLPASLRDLILSHPERHRGAHAMDRALRLKQFFFSQGYCVFPLVGTDYIGEMCVLRSQDRPPKMTPQEYMGYAQVACVTSATLDRARLFAALELRAEELSHALWKNQQINLQLLQTERLAAVGQLAAGAAHEINNPLAIISARSQLLEAREDDKRKCKDLRQISEQIERISAILKSLMGFAQPNSPRITRVDVNALLLKIVGLVEAVFRTHKISITRRLDPELPVILADANQLEQVFLNLIINAQHAMEANGGELTLSSGLADGQRVVVTVADTGMGIAPENLSRVFDPFFTTKSEGKGTGLGLSTAYGIVANHHGELKLESEVGQGTRMQVFLPVAAPLSEAATEAAEFVAETVPAARSASGGRILVVDDEQHIRDILTEALLDAGYSVETAVNGDDALRVLRGSAWDAIILDIRMPVRSGLDLLKLLHRVPSHPPILVLTGLASPDELEEALRLGATKCIRKPFHVKSLLEDVAEVVRFGSSDR